MTPASMETARVFGMIVAALVAAWVIADATRCGKSGGTAFLWGLGVFAVLILFLPLYLYGRAEEAKSGGQTATRSSTLCRYCGLFYEGDPTYCPHCSRQLKGVDEIQR